MTRATRSSMIFGHRFLKMAPRFSGTDASGIAIFSCFVGTIPIQYTSSSSTRFLFLGGMARDKGECSRSRKKSRPFMIINDFVVIPRDLFRSAKMTSSLSWVHDKISSKAEDVILHVLAAGPIPQHVAFVMDGNRRYARMNQKQTIQGHTDGFVALRRVRVGYISYQG